jgi:YVTN family beta-propeller protein
MTTRRAFALMLVLVFGLTVRSAWTAAPPQGDGSSGLLLVANKTDHTLSVIDAAAGKQVAAIPEDGVTGHEVIASPDGKTAYVPIYGDSGVGRAGSDGRDIAVIDLASRKVVARVDFGKPVRPHCPIFDSKKGLLYVTTELEQSVSIIDPKTLKVIGSVPTGQPESHMLVITRDGKRGYTSNVGAGTVSALDLDARKTIAVIPVSPKAQRISLSKDEKHLFTTDQTEPRLAIIDTATNKVAQWVKLPAIGFGTTPTPDGRSLLVTLTTSNQIAVVDLKTLQVVKTIDTPKAPQEILIRPDGKVAYVSCDVEAKIAAISLSDWKITSLIDAGKGADGLAWAASAAHGSH